MSTSDPVKDILNPQMQDAFWGSLNPDIRAELRAFEGREDWTYSYDELPDLFTQVAGALPSMVELPLTPNTHSILKDLIPLLAMMPMSQCMAAIVWLDNRGSRQPDSPGWGVLCFREAVTICISHPEDKLYPSANILQARIRTMLASKIAHTIFTRLNEEM